MNSFVAKSHPEADQQALAVIPPIAPQKLSSRAKPFNADLRDRLKAYSAEHGLSLAALARELATNPTAVSKYLNGKPEGDVAALEAMAEDVLKASVRRAKLGIEIFETSVTRQIHNLFETIRRTNGCGLIYGEAGLGKTCGAAAYLMQTPSALSLELRGWNSARGGVQALLFSAMENRTWNGNQRKADFMVDRLRGSKRIIIIDNAHKLTRGAREWLIDFHDETKCPMVLMGRTRLLSDLQKDQEQLSYFSLTSEVKFRGDEAKAALKLLEQRDPDAAAELADVATKVASHTGHLRALSNQVELARDLRIDPNFRGQIGKSFVTAHLKLPRNYSLL